MARVTIEDCLDHVDNRFALCLLATKRAHQLQNGKKALVKSNSHVAIVALREIAEEKVTFKKNPNELLGVANGNH